MWRDALVSLLIVAALALPAVVWPAPLGVLTIVEGDATVLRESRRFPAAEGLRLLPDDIVHTGEQARLVRIELAAGGTLDLGPATRLLLQSRFPVVDRPAPVYLLHGWLKAGAPKGDARSAAPGVASPRLDVGELSGTVVLQVGRERSLAFAESGRATLVERRDEAALRMHTLRDGDAYVQRGTRDGAVASRLPADALAQMPRAFADSLPLRAPRFDGVRLEPTGAADIEYDEAAPWINAEASLRGVFRQRWAAKARDARFRAGLVADLKSHPEWARVLWPEKFQPKKPAVAAARPAAPPAAKAAPAVGTAASPTASDATPVAAATSSVTSTTTPATTAATTAGDSTPAPDAIAAWPARMPPR